MKWEEDEGVEEAAAGVDAGVVDLTVALEARLGFVVEEGGAAAGVDAAEAALEVVDFLLDTFFAGSAGASSVGIGDAGAALAFFARGPSESSLSG